MLAPLPSGGKGQAGKTTPNLEGDLTRLRRYSGRRDRVQLLNFLYLTMLFRIFGRSCLRMVATCYNYKYFSFMIYQKCRVIIGIHQLDNLFA